MEQINKYISNKINEARDPRMAYGVNENDKTYKDIFNAVKDSLDKWGAGSVYEFHFSRESGCSFPVTKGKNIKGKDNWICIGYNPRGWDDNLHVYLCKYGNPEDASDEDTCYIDELPETISNILGI